MLEPSKGKSMTKPTLSKPQAKRKTPDIPEGESQSVSESKLVKLTPSEQTHSKRKSYIAKAKSGQVQPSTPEQNMSTSGQGLLNKVIGAMSPGKGDTQVHATEVPSESQKETSEDKLDSLKTMMQVMITKQDRQEAMYGALDKKIEDGLNKVDTKVTSAIERIQILEDNAKKCQVSGSSATGDRHEAYLLQQIEESNRCVTVLGAGKPQLSVTELLQLLSANKLAERGEVTVLAVQRLGSPKSPNPAFKAELQSSAMVTTVIDNSRTQNAVSNTEIRCVRYFPSEYAERAREMKAIQTSSWSAGLHSQIYFEGTTMCLKVKAKDSKRWMLYPSEFAKFRPSTVMPALCEKDESEETRAARKSMLSLLDINETNGKLTPQDLQTKSLTYTSKSSYLDVKGDKEILPKELVDMIQSHENKDRDDAPGATYVTRLVFESRKAAKEALEVSRLAARKTPLPEGDYLSLERLWAS